MKQLTKSVLETALNEELTEHLGHEKYGLAGTESGPVRNAVAKAAQRQFLAVGQLPGEVGELAVEADGNAGQLGPAFPGATAQAPTQAGLGGPPAPAARRCGGTSR